MLNPTELHALFPLVLGIRTKSNVTCIQRIYSHVAFLPQLVEKFPLLADSVRLNCLMRSGGWNVVMKKRTQRLKKYDKLRYETTPFVVLL